MALQHVTDMTIKGLLETIIGLEDEITTMMNELETRLPQIRYALEFNDGEFGLNHLRHLEKLIVGSKQS